ncbi:MAG: DUF2809 domain-containing protein [Confluentibacter sp.]|nr:DUF2809 domain-containing protein [Confluentibacter sp.]
MKMKLNQTYLAITSLLFLIEVAIALYLKTGFIRHTFGDFLVVILIYCFIKSFMEIHFLKLALAVWLFSFLIEFLQLTNILNAFHLQNNLLAKTILGSTFNVFDLVAYTLGIGAVLIVEYKRNFTAN